MIPSRNKSGFTLIELLLGLIIMATLLASVATAFHACMVNCNENEKIAEALQVARVVLHRLTFDVRTADAVDTGPARVTIIPPVNPENITRVEYGLSAGNLYLSRTVNGAVVTTNYIAANETVKLDGFSVSRETGVDGTGQTYTKSVTVVLQLHSGGNDFSLTASACPRRNLLY